MLRNPLRVQAYSVTKAAQIHLVKGLANMAAPKIRVNSVSPGLLLTVSPARHYQLLQTMRLC
jgi:NAD(P)-dependent dehydrogenase (short-subunit alcohol dehydrogenase family)